MKHFWDLLEENLGDDFAEDRELQATVRDLSLAFTEGRDALPEDYLNEPDLQAAYLAYFVPLNFEKVYMILSSHKGVWPAELNVDKPFRILDLGAGPGTAALAAMAAFKNRFKKLEKLPSLQIDLVDTQTGALNLAEILVRRFAEMLKLEVEVNLHTSLPHSEQYDLTLAANVLNELPANEDSESREALLQLWDLCKGVALVLEPGHRVSSQRLVRFRERLLKDCAPGEGKENVTILGPCPHQQKCPVHRTKHWCHFAEPVTDGRLIDLNLRIFKDPRSWLKFSYLLVSREKPQSWTPPMFRAIGDLHPAGPKRLAIDLCQPNEKFALFVPANIPSELRSTLVRGAAVTLDDDRQISARPMSRRDPNAFKKEPRPEARIRRKK